MISYYIYYYNNEDDLITETFEDFAGVLYFWNTHLSKTNTGPIVIHCGSDDIISEIPTENPISDIINRPIYFTESARWCIPKIYSSVFANPIQELVAGEANYKIKLYLSLYEWEHYISKEDIELIHKKYPEEFSISKRYYDISHASGWIKSLYDNSSISKNDKEVLLGFAILSPESYDINYKMIPDSLNFKCEEFRYHFHKEELIENDLNTLIKYMPYFLDNENINSLNLGVRAINGLIKMGVSKLGDMRNIHLQYLASQRNMGKKSLLEIYEKIHLYIKDSFRKTTSKDLDNLEIQTSNTFYDNIQNSLKKYILQSDKSDERKEFIHTVVKARLGLDNGIIPTLEELGTRFSVSRERIRQVVQTYINKIIYSEDWDDLMIEKINSLINENEELDNPEPLFLDMLDVKDKWFVGFEGNMTGLKTCIDEFSSQPKSEENIIATRKLSKTGRSHKEKNFVIIKPKQIERFLILKSTPLIKKSEDFDEFVSELLEKIRATLESKNCKYYQPDFESVLREESFEIINQECTLNGLLIIQKIILEIVIKDFYDNLTQQDKADIFVHDFFQNNDNLTSIDILKSYAGKSGLVSGERGLEQLLRTSLRKLYDKVYYLEQGKYGNKSCFLNKYSHLGESEKLFYYKSIDELTLKMKNNSFTCSELLSLIERTTPSSYFENYWIDVYFIRNYLSQNKNFVNDENRGKAGIAFCRV